MEGLGHGRAVQAVGWLELVLAVSPYLEGTSKALWKSSGQLMWLR